jgi:hypothetical protein
VVNSTAMMPRDHSIGNLPQKASFSQTVFRPAKIKISAEVWLLGVRRLLVGHPVPNSAFHQQKQAMISGKAHTYWRPAVTSHSVQPLAERCGIPFFDDLILPDRGDYLA